MQEQDSLVEYGFRRIIITILAVLCTLLEIVDTTIVNVALNDMKGSLGVTITDIAWVITSYAIANIIVIPMTSWLGQQFGRKNYFTASILLFTVSSFLCGNATNLWELVFFRFMQGLGGGALLVTAQTIITEIYPSHKRGIAQAIYGMGVIVGPTLGPPLGGYIVDNFSWPYIFYINVPLGIIAALLSYSLLKNPNYGQKLKASQVDWLGIILLSISIGSLQFVLEHGQQDDWFNDSTILTLSITAFFGIILFIWRELVYKFPIVNLRVLKNPNLRTGVILTFILGFGLFGSTFIIPIYTQSILGWTATQAGMLLVPSSIMTGMMMPAIGRLLQAGVKQKFLISCGFTLFFAYSYWAYTIITSDTSSEAFFYPLVVRGFAMGMLFVPITTLSLSTLQGKEIGEGAAMTGIMRQLGGSFGIAIITTMVSRLSDLHRSNLVSHLDGSSTMVQQRIQGLKMSFMSKGFPENIASEKAYQLLDLSVNKQATILSYMDIFLYLGIMFLVCVPFVLLLKNNKGKILGSFK